MKKFSLVISLLLPLCTLAEEIPGKTLLSYFAGSCRSSNEWTKKALADSESIIRTLDATIKDPDCSNAAGAISQLNSLSAQLLILDKMNETKNSIAKQNAEEQELLIQLTKTSDSNIRSEINSQLRSSQVERAKLLSSEKSGEYLTGADKVTVLSQIAQMANSSFQQIASNEKCIAKNPSLLESATSIVAGVGAAVTLVNPAIGLSLTAGATFTKVAMDGIKNSKHARNIRKIADSTVTFEAYRCALESMSERWCQMEDAEAFIKFKSKHRRLNGNKDLVQAISLNDLEIPTVLDWLTKVRNGVSPQTTTDADRRHIYRTRELIVRGRSDYGQSLIEQNRKAYDALADKPEDQWNFLRTIILSLAPQYDMSISSTSVKNPLNDIYGAMYGPFYLIGMAADDPRIKEGCNGICTFESWINPAGIAPTLDSVKSKYNEWIAKATNLVNRELSENQQPDAHQTLASAKLESEPWMVTPLNALKTIAEFIENNPPGDNQREFRKIYADTLDKLKNIHDITAVAIITGDMSPVGDKNLTPIEQIYEIAQLKYGIIVLQARLEMIVRLSLLEYIKNSPEEEQVLVAQLLASDRFYETISSMNGTNSFARLMEGIRMGQAYTLKNLSVFMEIFGHNINRILGKLYFEEQRSSPTVAEANRNLRTSMCFVALAADNAGDWIDLRFCKGLRMEAEEEGGPESIEIGSDTFKLDLKKRACTYREYFRQSDIYQKWGIKN